jgi:hypothetical protein
LRIAAEKISNVWHSGAREIFRRRIFVIDSRSKIEAGLAEKVLNKSRAIHRALPGQNILAAAELRMTQGNQGPEQFPDGIARAIGH